MPIDLSADDASGVPALPASYLNNPHAVAAGRLGVAVARENRSAERQSFNEDLQTQKLGVALSAADLHERQFSQKSATDTHRLSIADQQLELQKAVQVANLVTLRAKLQAETRKTLAGAALVESLGNLEPSDAKFPQKWAAAMAKYPEGVDTKIASPIIDLKKSDYELFQKAQEAHKAEIFKASLPPRIEGVMKSDHVDPALKSAIVGPDGSVNMDVLGQAEQAMKTGGAAKQGVDHLAAITGALKVLGEPNADKDTPAIRDARYNLQAVLKDKSFQVMQSGQPAAVPSAAIAPTAPADGAPAPVAAVPAAAPAATPAATPKPDVAALLNQYKLSGGASLKTDSAVPAPAPTEEQPAAQ